MKISFATRSEDAAGLARFRDVFAQTVADIDLSVERAAAGDLSFEGAVLGPALITRLRLNGTVLRRGPCEVAASGEGAALVLLREGGLRVDHPSGDTETVSAGEAILFPFESRCRVVQSGQVAFTGLRIGDGMLRGLRQRHGAFGSLKLGSSQGINAALAGLADNCMELAGEARDGTADRLGAQLLAFADILLADHDHAGADGQGERFSRMMQAIRARARDPEFAVAEVAMAGGVSRRMANLIFARRGTTITREIGEERLRLAKAMMAGRTEGGGKTVTGIALEAGFGDVSSFYRRLRGSRGRTVT